MKQIYRMAGFAIPIPILRSYDAAEAKEFSTGFLGFTVIFEHRNALELPLYFVLRRDDCDIHLSEHQGDATPGSPVRIAVPEVHAFCAELPVKDHKHARPGIKGRSYSCDGTSVTGPFGNRLIFCTDLEPSS